MNDDKLAYSTLLRDNLARAKRFREAAAAVPTDHADRMRLREWQSLRLARTHRDLLDSPRYAPAARFFLDDLYGPKDFSRRDEEVERIIPLLTRMLPASALHTIALAVGLDALSEELDSAIIAALRKNGRMRQIDDEAYAGAYRACNNAARREAQIALVGQIGAALAGLTRLPLLSGLLRAMRGPANLAGLGELHDFLERGFGAFKHMGKADEFLATVAARETALMRAWFAGEAAS